MFSLEIVSMRNLQVTFSSINTLKNLVATFIFIAMLWTIQWAGADAGGCHCWQCSIPKWLTLIFRAEVSFFKMLWTRFSNLTGRSCGRNYSKTLTSVEGYNFSCCLVLTQFTIPCNVLSLLASFPTTNLEIFWAALCVLFWSHGELRM